MADTKTATGCTVELIDYGVPCEEPDAVAYVTGCVGEHLDEDRYCGRHARLLFGGDLLCIECWRRGERVRVVALARVLPTGERVRVELPRVSGVHGSGGDASGSRLASPLSHE